MERVKHYGLYLLVGAGAHWIPDILIQWVRPSHDVWIILLTFLGPAIVATVWFVLSRRPAHSRFPTGLPLFMLLGIWVLGPLAIAIGILPAGGRLLETGQLASFFVMWAMFPVTTFIMSTYSGSLGGVGLSTLILVGAGVYSAVTRRGSAEPAK